MSRRTHLLVGLLATAATAAGCSSRCCPRPSPCPSPCAAVASAPRAVVMNAHPSPGVPAAAKEPAAAAQPTAAQPAEAGAPDMAEMMKLMAPGSQHEVLKAFEGSWTGTGEWSDMGMTSKFTEDVTGKMVFGGRFLQLDSVMTTEAAGEMPAMTMNGHGFIGYDNGRQKYVQAMVGDWSTAVGTSEGGYDAGTKTFTMDGEEVMGPGKKRKVRTLVKLLSADSWTLEIQFGQPDGSMKTAGKGTYTRKP